MMNWMHMTRIFQTPDTTAATAILLVIIAFYLRWKILELLQMKESWAAAAMLHCCAMLSGHMWNRIRKPAMTVKTKDGPVLISSGQRIQLMAESYIVAVLNGAIVLGMIMIIEAAGGVRGTDGRVRKRRRPQMWAGLSLMAASLALLLSLFTVKRPWYPYSFPLK